MIIKKCEVCQSRILKSLNLGLHPLCDDLIKVDLQNSKLYKIEILFCKKCFTLTKISSK